MQTVYYHRQWRSRAFSVTKPSAALPTRTRRRAWTLNPVIVAMKLQEQLEALPEQTHGALANQAGISRGKVCQYLRLLALPANVVSFMSDAANEEIAKAISEAALQSLLKLPSGTDVQAVFQSLFPK